MDGLVCIRNCWVLAAIAGVLVVLLTAGSTGPAGGLFLGLVTFVLSGGMLVWLLGTPAPELASDAVADAATSLDEWREAAPAEPVAQPVSVPQDDKTALLPIVAGAMPVVPQSKPEAAPQPEPVTAAAAADEPGDDLCRIKGIRRKAADMLNAQGITRFKQIAAWDEAMVADFANRLGQKAHRIQTDDWVGQARLLANGEALAHSAVVAEGEGILDAPPGKG